MTAAAMAAAAAAASRSTPAALTFSDEFASLSLDTGLNGSANWCWKWVSWGINALDANEDEAWKAHAAYDPGGAAQTPAEMGVVLHEVSAGTLKLYARVNPDPANYFGYGYLGGMISTELTHAQEFGTWECRARFTVTQGQHWAMWLVTQDYFFGGNGQWPEIDMVEIVSGPGSTLKLFMNDHANPPSNKTYFQDTVVESSLPAYMPVANTTVWQDWHVYKWVWTPDTMEWWIDDLLRMSCANFVPSGYPMHFMISPEVSGIWPGDPDGTTVWPQTAEIDYVRVYAGAPSAGPPPPADFSEDWTGSDGAAWNATRWPTIGVTSTSVVDILTNQGRMLPQGAAFARARAESASGNFTDVDVTIQFVLGGVGVEQYHTVNVRHTGSWTGNNPTNGYRVLVQNGFLSLTAYVAGSSAANFDVAKTWNTSMWTMRIQCIGTTIRVRAWQGTEPGTWDIEQTNSSHSTGIVTLQSLNGALVGGVPIARPIQWNNLFVTAL